ncbi:MULTISPECIES: phosphoenolpyruvate synthase [unclassified Bradyrhizobium]|uniref:phosphoenolpyruvate synthase n=1 Tax=unclassified Bradyrhizobium TaxID=2631580 RepID=UPI0028EBE29B|nr:MULTISPECIES: phosphoenolpyruvate synthase [unclassified Bradyrhizobium]
MVCEVLNRLSRYESIDALAGGKGRSLHKLTMAGFNVPRWAIVPSSVWESVATSSGLAKSIERILSTAEGDDLNVRSRKIQELIEAADWDPAIARVVQSAYEDVGTHAVAVRSSGADEDGLTHSHAGQYESFLNVKGLDEVYIAVKRCWASNYSGRALSYRRALGLQLIGRPMAVIIQRMIDADVSGVAFTANPSTGSTDEIVISAVLGLGEGLVSGKIDADTFVVDKGNYVTKSTTIGEKAEKVILAAEGSGVITSLTATGSNGCVCLSDELVASIAELGAAAENLYGCPQDLEWSVAGGVVHLLQSRPITTVGLGRRNGFGARIWENSNIIENFSGVTSPLTFSFARDVYQQIYLEYARLLGVPRVQLVRMNEWLRHMLGYHNGRVYYDLLNWYRIVRLVPFYSLNRRMLDLAIGVETPLPESVALRLDPLSEVRGWRHVLIRIQSAARFGWHFTTIARQVRSFVAEFHRHHSAVANLPLNEMSAECIHREFCKVRIILLSQWGRMILLEQSIGLAIGILTVLLKRWLPNGGQRLLFDLLRPAETLDSILPVQRLTELAQQIRQTPALAADILQGDEREVDHRLRSSDDPNMQRLVNEIDKYIAEFGDRSLNELKLEEPDLRERPAAFFAMLRAHLAETTMRQAEDAHGSIEHALASLWPWKRWIIRIVANKATSCLAARERVRFCRTRAFGSVRRMVKAIGKDLADRHLLMRPEDIFMVRLEELRDWGDGVLTHGDIVRLIEHRSAQIAVFKQLDAPPRFVSDGYLAACDYAQSGWCRPEEVDVIAADPGTELKGTPCGGGRVSGFAAVITEPLNVPGKILVTYRTDPGWCAVLPSAVALLIERGSPLTHVAIVARELNIPTIIQVKDLTRLIRTGARLDVDGVRGTILVNSNPVETVRAPEGLALS